MENPVLIGLTCGAIFLLAFLLINPPDGRNLVANRWLAVFAAAFGGAMLEILLHILRLELTYRILLDLTEVSRFLAFPALYLSISSFVDPDRRFCKKELFHLLPFACFLMFMVPHMRSGQNIEITSHTLTHVLFSFFRITFPLQIGVYWLLSYRKLLRHKQNIKKVVSSVSRVDLGWLERFLWVLAAVIVLWLNLAFFKIAAIWPVTPGLYLVSAYFLAYYAVRQQEVYPFQQTDRQEIRQLVTEDSVHPKRQKRVNDQDLPVLKLRLQELMVVGKPYLDAELSLPGLAEQMRLSVHELSYVINEAYQKNFFSFVNHYRIEEAKRLLLSDAFVKLNVLGVAFESGFNSKTTFNTAFKKSTGMSPSAFAKTGHQ